MLLFTLPTSVFAVAFSPDFTSDCFTPLLLVVADVFCLSTVFSADLSVIVEGVPSLLILGFVFDKLSPPLFEVLSLLCDIELLSFLLLLSRKFMVMIWV